MKCTEREDLLLAYVEDSLAPGHREALDAHLKECRRCRATIDGIVETHVRLVRDGQIDPPAELTGAVMNRILRGAGRPQPQSSWRRIMTHRYVAASVAAAACIAAVAGAAIVAQRMSGDKPPAAIPEPSAKSTAAAHKSRPANDDHLKGRTLLERRSLRQIVHQSPVIVVARPVDSVPAPPNRPGDVPELLIRFRVVRTLKGKLKDKHVTIQKPGAPVGAGVDELAGHDWLLLLSPEFVAGKHRYAALHTIKAEAEVRAMLAGKAGKSK